MANGELSLRDELAAGFAKTDDPAPATTTDDGLDDAGMPKLNQGDLPLPAGGPRAPEFQKQRDPSGRFLPSGKQATEPAAAAPAAPSAQSPSVPGQEAPAVARTFAPPPGWTATAKAEFAKLPPVVQEAVAKREEEINNGFKKLQTYKGLDDYIETAARAGTTVPEALDRYMESEALLERDPVRGLLWLCQTYNIDPRQLVQGGQPQQQNNQQNPYLPQQSQNPYEMQRFIQPVAQEVNQLKQMLAAERQNKIADDINAFASDPKNQYFENVADQMAMIISAGSTAPLSEIYEQACYMNQEVRGLLIREQTAKAQADQVAKAKQVAASARQAGNSVTGGTGSPAPSGSPNLSLRDEISGLFYGNRA